MPGSNKRVAHELPFSGAGVADLSPELTAWHDDHVAPRLPATPPLRWVAAGCATLFAATKARDSVAVARLQAIFLPVSTVQLDGDTHLVACWHATDAGTSCVYAATPDGTLQLRHASIADLVAGQWLQQPPLPAPPPLRDPIALLPRTRWLVTLLLGVQSDDPADVPSLTLWHAERAHLEGQPHLQAYWVVHHMLLGNHDALAVALAAADDRYPPIPELRALATAFATGDEPRQLVGAGRLLALRSALLDRGGDVLSEAARDQVAQVGKMRGVLSHMVTTTHEALRFRDDPDTIRALEAWGLLGRCAGHLDKAERELLDAWHPDGPAREDLHHRLGTGEATPLVHPMRALLAHVDNQWAPLFEAAFRLSAPFDEDDPQGAPGALVGWGAALGSFTALHERFHEIGRTAGRRRFLELAMVAGHFPDDEGAEAFLLGEVHGFARELGGSTHGTTSYALLSLLERRHPEALRLAVAFLQRGPMNTATVPLLAALVDHAAHHGLHELLPGLVALRRRGFGLGSARRRRLEAVCSTLGDGG